MSRRRIKIPPSLDKGALFFHLGCLLLGMIMFYPIAWMVLGSFKTHADLFMNVGSLLPRVWRFQNYSDGLRAFGKTPFTVFFKNSFIITTVTTLANILASAVVAYGFARNRFFGRRVLFTVMMMTMMLPYQMVMIPQYILFHKLGWINTFLPLLVPPFLGGSPFFTFLVMQFIRGIPASLDESATIDGCSKYTIFTRIVFPLLKTPLVTVSIFSFYWTWQDLLKPMIYLNKPRLFTVSIALSTFRDPLGTTNWSSILAMSVLSLLPVVLVFFFLQRNIIEGISLQGLKG